MILYDSPFSPFARKVRIVMSLKGLEAQFIDALTHQHSESLHKVNPRSEVPALIDDDLVVVNSSDIVAYLEHQYPKVSVLPSNPQLRVKARKWERMSDSLIDPIMVNISYWMWAVRDDKMPSGMLEAARKDLAPIYDQLESELAESEFICGELSIADIALFPHFLGAKALGVPFSAEHHPKITRWLQRLRTLPAFAADIQRATHFLNNLSDSNIEREKIFWRGERVEWLLANGFDDWFFNEINRGRVIWPSQTL